MEKVNIGLLVSYLEGFATDHEKETVDKWIHENPDNEKNFRIFKEAWSNPHELASLSSEAINSDWDKIRIQAGKFRNIHSRAKTKMLFAPWLKRIAGILVFLAAIWTAYFLGNRNTHSVLSGHSGYNKIVVPKGEKSQLILSDGTKIFVNAGSTLRFPDHFSAETRDVWLDGEAFFEVTKDKARPFLVHTSELDVKVHGTKFNLKAYDEENIIETTLVEGIVSLETRNLFNQTVESVFLEPNHKAIYLKKSTKIVNNEIKREVEQPLEPKKIIISKPVEVEPAISWREGKLIFIDETFDNIAVKLERRYGVNIEITNDEIKHVRYTGILKNVSIEQALKAIQLTTNIAYSIHENSIVISLNSPSI
jgi:ferric-dicitrate binding protein FerR (iron transport regulator)